MTDISAANFFRQAAADGGDIDFEHEEIDTGGTKRPTKIHLHAVDPGSGDRMGTLTYHVPRRKADKILVEHLGTEEAHRGKGVASQLMDEMQRRHPATPIDHGDRTDDGKAWWAKYTDGKKVTRGRTIASLTDTFRTTASHPRAELPPEQQAALEHPSFSEYRRRSLELAKNPTPGTVVWRGEARSGEPHDTLRESGVGMHWTVNPDSVLVPRPHEGQRRVLWQGRIEHPEQQTIPRSHPSWGGRTGHSMDHEAEVRFQPGAKVHMEGAYVWHGQGDPEGHPVPRMPERTHPDWKWHPIGQHAEVRNLGHIDYGQHDQAPASDAKMPPPWHGADPHTALEHEHQAGNHYSNYPGHDLDDVDWDAPDEHSGAHSSAIMTDGVLRDGWVKPHELSHEDASEWLRWHPDRAGIEQRHNGLERQAFTTPVPDNTQPYEHEHPWLPRDHFFAPGEKGLDPRLFDDGERMHPAVRQHILGLLHGFWAPKYGDAWQSWARVYLAGSEASHFYGNGDLDILIGVDYDRARDRAPALASLSDEEISTHLTDELRHGLNDDARMLPGPDGKETGPWENTWYVNPDSYDIRDIKPYAAYDITRDEWAVKPVEVPDDFGPEKLPESTWDVFEAVQKLIGAIRELPEGVREREGAALYDYLHTDRHSAFGPEGSGLYDPANAVWKALDKAPDQPLQQLIDWKHAHDGVAAATDQEKAA